MSPQAVSLADARRFYVLVKRHNVPHPSLGLQPPSLGTYTPSVDPQPPSVGSQPPSLGDGAAISWPTIASRQTNLRDGFLPSPHVSVERQTGRP